MTALAVWWSLLVALVVVTVIVAARADHNRQVRAAMKRHPAGRGRS